MPAFAYAILMETLRGFPNLPALWLRRAKPGCAYANYFTSVLNGDAGRSARLVRFAAGLSAHP